MGCYAVATANENSQCICLGFLTNNFRQTGKEKYCQVSLQVFELVSVNSNLKALSVFAEKTFCVVCVQTQKVHLFCSEKCESVEV